MPTTRKICSPYPPPHAAHPPAASTRSSDQAATDERVDNIRILPLARGGGGPVRAAVERMKLWDNGRTLRVKFIDGLPEVQAKVQAIAREWEAIANLKLKFVTTGAAEIRISFAEKGFSWSTVGTDALTVAATEATMNYGWLEPSTSLREYQRVVRHEFGHALGMIHEHQNPAAQGQIPWDKEKVYAHYAQQGWTREDVDFNIFQVYTEDSTNHTAFDPASIMEYAIPDSLTVGSYAVGWNTDFSPADIEFMRKQYPMASAGTVELAVGGPRTSADLATAGEVDTYHFDVPAAATHIMTTEGPSDTVLTLHGPNDSGAVLAWDDDRGQGLNARIVRKLQPGSYWLSVRHKNAQATGTYTVGVKKSR
ncbi:M12 family metallopeptidase [Variovorax soli]|uniref:M12 family metallopeptidase n=1 Tax=Variovorax soli TaxID=376815 RepID=UPI000838FEA3|nr:M12 family metallopeptidase [Variovorax soli]